MRVSSRVRHLVVVALAASSVASFAPVAGAADPAPAKVVALAKAVVAKLGTAPEVVKAVKAQNANGTSLADVQAFDRKWMATPGVADFMKALIDSACGTYLRKVQAYAPYYSEIFVTDKLGANVAMTGKTSDYWQGDEPKFTESWKAGAGVVFVSDIGFDKSTQTYVVHVSVPVKDGGSTIGVLVAGIDVDKAR
jgi:hypothetical protein